MKESFRTIERWLSENAPKIVTNSLQPPVAEEQWGQFNKSIGKDLPDDFKQLYLWHNGMNDDENLGSLFYGMSFYTVEEMLQDKENRGEREQVSLQQNDQEIKPDNICNPDWIRFAFDGAHTGLYIDLDPGIGGTYGQVIFIDDEYEVGMLVADSIRDLVHQFIIDLDKELYHLHEDALEDGNHFLEADDSIDIINWQDSMKWNRLDENK
ncbi:SMI1/KNR4 family protein [Chryseobacterium tructae]|uniref:SMI1/KNR4 family protein n=1 Tax=Chryseobacterium tructae TaxID=1037380 RepID=A0ABV7Y0K5_9FLAO|nr:SMI1/KNR4 family protein [Chryseobacterium tructae]MDN3694471.1 SMI1/KNR4 family protein [Chryseobacterium tructae]